MQLSAHDTPTDSLSTPRSLLTPSESLFHACLEQLTLQRCHIQCKPRLADVLQHETLAGFHKICQRHIDFLIYRKEDWLPMLAIEFDADDDSSARLNRKSRDRQLVNEVLLATGIPLLRVHVKEIDDIETLMYKLTAAWQQRCVTLTAIPPPVPEIVSRPPTQPLETCPPTRRLTSPMLAVVS